MKSAGQKTSNLKLAAALLFVNLFGIGSSLACINPPPSPTPSFGCGVDSATAYAVRNSSSSYTFQAAEFSGPYSGAYGVIYSAESTLSPQHAMDNDGRTELIALHFDSKVVLDTVTLGWTQNDADFSLLAWNGTGSTDIAGKTISGLLSAWTLVGNYSNAAKGDTDIVVDVNSGKTSSSWWIISAYNANYKPGSTALDTNFDYMKVLAVACDPGGNTNVPEPGSMMLLGAGLFGMMALRRRRQTQV